MALTFLPFKMYTVSVAIGFLLFGLGLGFYATPSTDTAISNTPSSQAGTASGVYKMGSSLGSSFRNVIILVLFLGLLIGGYSFESIKSATTVSLLANVVFGIIALAIVPPFYSKNSPKISQYFHCVLYLCSIQ